jgi:hypothetical protein
MESYLISVWTECILSSIDLMEDGVDQQLVYFVVAGLILACTGAFAFLLHQSEKKSVYGSIISIGLVSFGWLVGAGFDLFKIKFGEQSIPESALIVNVGRLDVGYFPIELARYDRLLNQEQLESLLNRDSPRDQIDVSENFAASFNSVSKDSVTTGLLLPRTYYPEEFMSILSSGLAFYGDYRSYSVVADGWIETLRRMKPGDIGALKGFIDVELGGYLQGAGLINSTIGQVQREGLLGNLPLCGDQKANLATSLFNAGGISIELESFFVNVQPFFEKPDQTARIAERFVDLINGGCSKELADFFEIGAKMFHDERKLVAQMISMVNDYYKVATPRTIKVRVIVLNPGKYGAAIPANGVLKFDSGSLPELKISAVKSAEGRFVFTVPSRDVREIEFEADLPQDVAERLSAAYRAGTSKFQVEIRAILEGRDQAFLSPLADFKQ